MNKIILSGGCSFTFGNELSDDKGKNNPSAKTWAKGLNDLVQGNHFCVAKGGIGNSAIARKVFEYISKHRVDCVVVMWSFPSRYDWAMPRNKNLEQTRWASITPWEADQNQTEVFKALAGSEPQQEIWKKRRNTLESTGVRQFANSLYRHHELDRFMWSLYKEIDFTKWFSFGERMMGFNQWALLNDYKRGTTHPLDQAHKDAVQLMKTKFLEIINQGEPK